MKAIFAIGRFNPPTIGHEFLFKTMKTIAIARSLTPFLFVVEGKGTSKDRKRNPLTGQERVSLIRQMFGFDSIIIPTAYDAFAYIGDKINPSILLCGEDRKKAYEAMIGHSGTNCELMSLDRDIVGHSSSEARNAAISLKFAHFRELIPTEINDESCFRLMRLIHKRIADG